MLKVRGWRKFQHFKDRTPPWIKLYRDLLDDPDWHALDGEAAKTLTMLWLLASEDETKSGAIPDIRKAAFRLRMSQDELSAVLDRLGDWIEVVDITPISRRYHDDAPEAEAEAETETETETEAEVRARGAQTAADNESHFQSLKSAMASAGFRHEAVHKPKPIALLRQWVAQGVTPDDIADVAAMLREREPGKTFSPGYLGPPMAEYLEAKRNGNAQSRRPGATGRRKSAADNAVDFFEHCKAKAAGRVDR